MTDVPKPNSGASAAGIKNIAAKDLKVFIRARVDLNLALGTLLKNPMFEEAEAEFQNLASFQTRIALRNALQARCCHLLNYAVALILVHLSSCLKNTERRQAVFEKYFIMFSLIWSHSKSKSLFNYIGQERDSATYDNYSGHLQLFVVLKFQE